jgi:Flp pilus assembly protein CpaB
MKSKSLILMVIAMGCGLAAAYTTAKLTAKSSEETDTVLVANSEIKIGTVIKEPEKLFTAAEYKKGTALGAVTDIEKIKDKIVTRTIRAGNFVNGEDLSSNFGITPPKGTKAMSIKVTPDASVAGFVLPGSRVDILATICEQNDKPEVITILQNQEVLAVDTVSVRPDGQSAMQTVNNVTLAVKPFDAQRLELALRKSGGVVRLLLRDQNDTTTTRIAPAKNLTDASIDFGAGDAIVPKALAATRDLTVGTVIDEPEKMFQAVPVAAMPERGFLEGDMSKLKGKTLQVPLFKDSFATAKHFEIAPGAGKMVTAAANEPVRTILYIQNGGREPQTVVYQDGVMITSEGGGSRTPPATEKNDKADNNKAPDKADRPS